jgi:type II secretory pathway pseudopilin PulG
LIEVLIVVAIMAILAGVVISLTVVPVKDAEDSVRLHNLRLAETCLFRYQLDHASALPTIQDNSLPQMSASTNAQGEIGPAGPDYPYGPYWNEAPVNPADGSSSVTAVLTPGQPPTGPVGTLGGWQFDQTTGGIWPNDLQYYNP